MQKTLLKGTSKNQDFSGRARKHCAQNRSLHAVNEDSSTQLTWLSREKTAFRVTLNFTLAFLFNLLALTPSFANNNNAAIEQLLTQSGVNEQIQQFPNAMAYKIEQIYAQGQCDENSFITINKAIQKTINKTSMKTIVLNDVAKHLNPLELQELNNWYNSPLGKKISRLEQASSSSKAYDEIRKEGGLLLSNKKRLAMVQDIDNAIHATDWAVNVELQSTIAMLGGLAQIQHKNITANLVQFASTIEEQKSLLRPQVEKSILLWYMYTYKSLSKEELNTYIEFLKKENTQKFNSISLKSLSHAITTVVEDFIITIETDSLKP